jgi:hypothetical protein
MFSTSNVRGLAIIIIIIDLLLMARSPQQGTVGLLGQVSSYGRYKRAINIARASPSGYTTIREEVDNLQLPERLTTLTATIMFVHLSSCVRVYLYPVRLCKRRLKLSYSPTLILSNLDCLLRNSQNKFRNIKLRRCRTTSRRVADE